MLGISFHMFLEEEFLAFYKILKLLSGINAILKKQGG